jgi:hypothetical protein
LAEKKQAFVFDSHLGSEIWNESAIGYQRQISPPTELTELEKAKFPNAVKKASVRVQLESLAEIDIKKSNTLTKKSVSDGKLHEHAILEYNLYIDANGKSIDGDWKNSMNVRGVDFIWFGAGKGTDSKDLLNTGNPFLDFNRLKKIFDKSTKPICKSFFL